MTVDDVLDGVLRREGGYVHHPQDRGGPTHRGITLQTLREWRYPGVATQEDLRQLTEEEARRIYRRIYVEAPGYAETIQNPRLLALVVDYAVHSGPGRATKALQRALGVTDDGILGARTAAALARAQDDPAVYRRLLADRLKHLVRLVLDDATQRPFLDGWINRWVEFA